MDIGYINIYDISTCEILLDDQPTYVFIEYPVLGPLGGLCNCAGINICLSLQEETKHTHTHYIPNALPMSLEEILPTNQGDRDPNTNAPYGSKCLLSFDP